MFIPPKGEDPKMYDIYKSPEEITPVVASEQEAATPEYMEDDDSEPGYVLTPIGRFLFCVTNGRSKD